MTIREKIFNYITTSFNNTANSDTKEYLSVLVGSITNINNQIFPFTILTEDGRNYETLLSRSSALYKTFVKPEFVNEKFVFVVSNDKSISTSLARVHFITKYTEENRSMCEGIAHEINSKHMTCDDMYFESLRFDEETEKSISRLPAALQLAARRQLTSKTFEIATESDRASFTKSDLSQLYKATKTTYPVSTQQRLNALLSKSVADNKNMVQSILAVSSGYHPERITTAELRGFLNEKVSFREQEINAIVTAIESSRLRGKGARILLVGPEGCGKTALANAIATARKKPYITIPFYSFANLIDMAGCSSVFDSAAPGSFYKNLMATGTTDVTAIFEKIDKASHEDRKNGDCDTGLLGVLQGMYYDTFLEADFDMSNALIICEAENEANVSAKIKSSFDAIIHVRVYTDEERFELAKKVLIPRIISEISKTVSSGIHIDDDTIRYVIKTFCHDEGLKILNDSLGTLIMKTIDKGSNLLTHRQIDAYLGLENMNHDHIAVIHKNKDYFDRESYQIIEKMISSSKNENDKAKSELAKKQLSVISSVIKPRENEELSFNFDKFMSKTNESHDGMKEVKLALARQFSRLARTNKGGNLLLISTPGQGKTTLCRSAADAVGIPFFKVSCNGVTDPNYFKGTISSVNLGSEGAITKALAVTGKRAVILLDEIDKLVASTSSGYMVVSSLLDLLDERKFSDHYLDGVRLDLSEVIFVATANYADKIPLEVLNRFETLSMSPYSKKQQKNILRDYILPSIYEENQCSGDIAFAEEAIEFLINNYYFSTGARQLRVTASKIVETILLSASTHIVTIDDIVEIIGAPTKVNSVDDYDYVPGCVNGLGVNSLTGIGSITIIDCAKIQGNSKVTGCVEGSALESIEVAKAAAATINPNCANANYHVHFGAGEASVRKDGSSAGMALALAILSCENEIPTVGTNAFTGETDIRGNIYAVGGVPEKIRGAIEAGCTRVFIPESNYMQLKAEELDEFSIEAEVIPVKKLSDIIDKVMPESEIKKLAS